MVDFTAAITGGQRRNSRWDRDQSEMSLLRRTQRSAVRLGNRRSRIYIYIYMYLEHARISTRFCSIRCTPTPSSFLIPRIHMDIKRSCSAINPAVHRVHQHYEFVIFSNSCTFHRHSKIIDERLGDRICINALTIGDVLLVISRNIQRVTKFDCIVVYLWVD